LVGFLGCVEKMVVVECSYVYDGIPWDMVNEYCDKFKKNCLMDPTKVKVKVDERADGSTSFLFTAKVMNLEGGNSN
jgi:hypothetical protein